MSMSLRFLDAIWACGLPADCAGAARTNTPAAQNARRRGSGELNYDETLIACLAAEDLSITPAMRVEP